MPRRACNPPPPLVCQACQIQAQIPAGVFNHLMKSDNRTPGALASPLDIHSTSTRFPVYFLPPSIVFYHRSGLGGAQNSNSGRIGAQIRETLCKLRSPGAQNSNSGRIWAQILETLCELRYLGAQNPKSKHLWTQILVTLCKACSLGARNWNSEHSGQILLRILFQAINQFD